MSVGTHLAPVVMFTRSVDQLSRSLLDGTGTRRICEECTCTGCSFASDGVQGSSHPEKVYPKHFVRQKARTTNIFLLAFQQGLEAATFTKLKRFWCWLRRAPTRRSSYLTLRKNGTISTLVTGLQERSSWLQQTKRRSTTRTYLSLLLLPFLSR